MDSVRVEWLKIDPFLGQLFCLRIEAFLLRNNNG